MQISLHAGAPVNARTDLLVVGVFTGDFKRSKTFQEIDRTLRGALMRATREVEFAAKNKQKLIRDTLGALRIRRVALLGLGAQDEADARTWVNLAGQATRIANDAGARSMLLVAPSFADANAGIALLARGARLGDYRFDRYRSDKGRRANLGRVALAFDGERQPKATARTAIRRGTVIADAVILARDLVNEPGSELYPESFAKRAASLARRAGLYCRIWREPQLVKAGMRLLLGVGQGSARPPRMVHLRYQPAAAKRGSKPIVLVGKGITFDSGGLSLKPNASMLDMKADMAGAAAVVAAMQAVAQLKPRLSIHAVLALAENMPSGSAIRVGDIIRGASGKTVEINNTDAEGRLVLADALHYALGLGPRRIIDLATLTGACVVALGPHTVGAFANDDQLATELLASAERAGEHFWRLPLTPALRETLNTPIADIKNTGERWGGAITAALFLEEFVGKTPWAHLDIAGPATSQQEEGATSKGATGVGVATLVEMLV
jgi:leucyl aminopeptidase